MPSPRGFVGLAPRQFALTVLRLDAPATLDWIEPNDAGPMRRLPLMAATRDGYRFGSVPIEPDLGGYRPSGR